ncbi:MAG: hypothetical protein IJ934_05495 [Acetobacter sp.]|nr:hypothetical protein [Acetobacter sp.]
MSDSDQDKAEKPVKLVHYTTAEAAYSILSKGELWMRKASLMNDFKEAKLLVEVMEEYTNKLEKSLRSNEPLRKACEKERAR